MANHMASIKTPCVAKVVKDVDLFDYTIKRGTIVKVEKFDKVNNEYICKTQPFGREFCASGDHLKVVKAKTFAIDVHFDLARSFEVKAQTEEEAEKIIEDMITSGDLTYTDNFEQTDDYECRCSGKENAEGMIEYF